MERVSPDKKQKSFSSNMKRQHTDLYLQAVRTAQTRGHFVELRRGAGMAAGGQWGRSLAIFSWFCSYIRVSAARRSFQRFSLMGVMTFPGGGMIHVFCV